MITLPLTEVLVLQTSRIPGKHDCEVLLFFKESREKGEAYRFFTLIIKVVKLLSA